MSQKRPVARGLVIRRCLGKKRAYQPSLGVLGLQSALVCVCVHTHMCTQR